MFWVEPQRCNVVQPSFASVLSASSSWPVLFNQQTTPASPGNQMNNGILESLQTERSTAATRSADELTKLKAELMKAEVRLARARATAAGAEVDVKVLSARLKAAAN